MLAKMLQAQKKYRENCKHQFKMFSNEIRTRDKPQKAPKAPGRENSIARQVTVVPSKLPTGQQKNFGYQFKKKMNQSEFKKKKSEIAIGRDYPHNCVEQTFLRLCKCSRRIRGSQIGMHHADHVRER